MPALFSPPQIGYNGDSMARLRGNDFEKSFQQLERIVQRLESEELPLDEALRLFEEGIGLSRFCHAKLSEVEKKIELILADAKGEPRTEPFEATELESETGPPGLTGADEDEDEP
ncbi:MAG TPA: exodeoxyribonuclease VII small subunit [Thermoanaerobaculia bacterium]|nr:exodeoxyribonuclease VII small subunit [Thermoanaerobaculia bacterium]